jgi:hypothetical protein
MARDAETAAGMAPLDDGEATAEPSVPGLPAEAPAADPRLAAAVRNGTLRRLRFRLDHPESAAASQDAFAEVQAALRDDPTFAYAQLLAVRQEIWRADPNTLPSFAVAFEQALADADKARLQGLAERHPRLVALILVARALLGDEDAAWAADALLRKSPAMDEARPVTILRAALRPILDRTDGLSPLEALVANDNVVRHALHDANEAGLGELLVA